MLGTWLRALYSHATLAVLSWRVGTRSRDADPEFALPPFLLDQPEPTKLSRIGRLLPLARFREYHRSLSVPMGDAWQRLRAELAWLVHGSHWSCIRFPEPRIRRALHGDRKQEDPWEGMTALFVGETINRLMSRTQTPRIKTRVL
jgi:hypothetical protein